MNQNMLPLQTREARDLANINLNIPKSRYATGWRVNGDKK